MLPEPRPTIVPRDILIHPAVWPQQTWAENWRLCLLFGRGAGTHLVQCGLSRDLPPYQVGAGSPCNTVSLWSRPTFLPTSAILIHRAIWPQQIWPENWGGGPEFPSNTMWPGPSPTCMPSFVLIRPTVWPQYTNVTDRTRQDRQTTVRCHRVNRFADGRPTYGIVA